MVIDKNNENIFAYDVDYFDDREEACFANGVVVAPTMRSAASQLYDFFDGAIQRMELTYLDPQDENTDIYVREHGEWCI